MNWAEWKEKNGNPCCASWCWKALAFIHHSICWIPTVVGHGARSRRRKGQWQSLPADSCPSAWNGWFNQHPGQQQPSQRRELGVRRDQSRCGTPKRGSWGRNMWVDFWKPVLVRKIKEKGAWRRENPVQKGSIAELVGRDGSGCNAWCGSSEAQRPCGVEWRNLDFTLKARQWWEGRFSAEERYVHMWGLRRWLWCPVEEIPGSRGSDLGTVDKAEMQSCQWVRGSWGSKGRTWWMVTCSEGCLPT